MCLTNWGPEDSGAGPRLSKARDGHSRVPGRREAAGATRHLLRPRLGYVGGPLPRRGRPPQPLHRAGLGRGRAGVRTGVLDPGARAVPARDRPAGRDRRPDDAQGPQRLPERGAPARTRSER